MNTSLYCVHLPSFCTGACVKMYPLPSASAFVPTLDCPYGSPYWYPTKTRCYNILTWEWPLGSPYWYPTKTSCYNILTLEWPYGSPYWYPTIDMMLSHSDMRMTIWFPILVPYKQTWMLSHSDMRLTIGFPILVPYNRHDAITFKHENDHRVPHSGTLQ